MTQERRYIPNAGDRVHLQLFGDYSPLGLKPWTRLTAKFSVDGNVTCDNESGEIIIVPLDKISPPVGWRSRYTIHAQPDKVSDVLGWMQRGIVVRFSQSPFDYPSRKEAEAIHPELIWVFDPPAHHTGIRSTFNHAERWLGQTRGLGLTIAIVPFVAGPARIYSSEAGR